ncbi:MAG TPA: ribulose bisphosphate carboxylase small subunit [Acidimicrobiia bacterium]|nr:ribulose bisphosphate carboxylase small subunit [Acidimicrobiia bacterium]
MRLTQGTFSYLPDFTDEEIAAQARYAVERGWALAVEYSDDPHPRNVYWEMWGLPYFDVLDTDAVVGEVNRCRATFPDHYIRLTAYDANLGRQTTALSFIVNRPEHEPGFALARAEGPGRTVRYALERK